MEFIFILIAFVTVVLGFLYIKNSKKDCTSKVYIWSEKFKKFILKDETQEEDK